MDPSQLIATLNSMTVGDLDGIRARLVDASEACRSLGQEELAGRLEEAALALLSGDLRTYRRRVETVVARLGHLR